jgi:two-component system nitrogen regulation sensor histidine kinase NtrY
MTFRTRLLAGFGVVVLVPLAVFGLGIRREMSGRLTAEYERRVGALVQVIRADVARQSDGIAARHAALKGAISADNRFRVAAIQGGDRPYVLDYAGDAMRLAGLDFLQVLDDEGHVVSSGHFRNEYDRPAAVPVASGPALVRARAAEGPFLALVRTDSLRLGGRRFTLVGGVRVDSLFLSRLARDPELTVSVVLPGDSAVADSSGVVVGEVALPYVGSAGEARIVVTQSRSLLAALRRNVNLWFAVAVLVTSLVAVLMAGWLSTRFSRPLSEMERRVVMGDLARQVNHDIKNGLGPLRNVFRHLVQVAQGEPATLAQVFAERQGTIESSIAYLETLAANYARLSPQTDQRPTDLNAVVREALRHAAPADHAELRTELTDGLPPVRADGLVLRRVIENLLGNALDSLEGRPGTVTVATERAGGVVRLSVSDTGRGMTKDELDRAFDDFYTTKPGGTGLGLSIVRRLVLDSNGALRVESEPGKGSRFIVELPAVG